MIAGWFISAHQSIDSHIVSVKKIKSTNLFIVPPFISLNYREMVLKVFTFVIKGFGSSSSTLMD